MRADTLSTHLDQLDPSRTRLRGEPDPTRFLTCLEAGAAAWERAIAHLDRGGEAEEVLPEVATAFAPDPDVRAATRAAQEVVDLGVAAPVHHFLVAVDPPRTALRKASQSTCAHLRRVAALERKSRSRWRGHEGRAAILVDRDLSVEELRHMVRPLLADARAVILVVRRWMTAP